MANIVVDLFTALGAPNEIVHDIDARAYSKPDCFIDLVCETDFSHCETIKDVVDEFLLTSFTWNDSEYYQYYVNKTIVHNGAYDNVNMTIAYLEERLNQYISDKIMLYKFRSDV